MPVSKALTIFLKENHMAEQLVVDGGGGWRDPSVISTNMIFCNETYFCEKLLSHLKKNSSSAYLESWKKMNELTKENMAVIRDVVELSEAKLFYQLAEFLPAESTLFVGNSMPIRDLDSFFISNQKSIKVMANRGANGIDGTVSTAIGTAVYRKSVYLVLGDLTFFHDLNGLIAAKLMGIDIHIILVNNNGGGIFSFLPQSEHTKHFELLFGTPLNIDFEHAVKMFNGHYTKIGNWDQLRFRQIETEIGRNIVISGVRFPGKYQILSMRDRNDCRSRWGKISFRSMW
jgi:2-succinyl-5-enolpyruvyl-6-hydroxy-3-cyclohexene-1-carboxylate synthase